MALPTLRIKASVALPDNDQWQNRFTIKSQSSGRIYTIAQHKKLLHWGCSCPGWKAHRHCKHLTEIGLPGDEKPHPVNVINP